jgi:hypothetical protein
LPQFARAGKILTRTDNQILNTIVAISVPVLLVGLVALICRGLNGG